MSKAKRLFWSYALKGMVGLGVPMAFLPLKIKAADAAQFETAKNEVGVVLADIKAVFESQKGVTEQRMPATSKDAKRLLKAIDTYNKNASQAIEVSGKNEKEKVRALNELLGVKVDGKAPDYLTYQTVVELEKKMSKINVDTVYGADIAAMSASAVGMVAEEAPKKEEAVPEKEKKLEPTPYVEEEAPEITFGAPKKEEAKPKEEAKAAVAGMTDLEKAKLYLSVLDVVKPAFAKPAKPAKKAPAEEKEEYKDKLAAYNQLNKIYKDLSAAKKNLEKGKPLKAKQQKALEDAEASLIDQLKTASFILSGTEVTNPLKAQYMAYVTEGTPESLKKAVDILRSESTLFVKYLNQQISIHEKQTNAGVVAALGKKEKVDYQKEAKKLGYDLSTVGGALQMLDWIYHNDNELYYKILNQEAAKAEELSDSAEKAISDIAGLRKLRGDVWNEQQTAQSKKGGKEALNTAIESAKTTFGEDSELVKAAKALAEAKNVDTNMLYEAALALLTIQEAQIWYDTKEVSKLKETNEAEVVENLEAAKMLYGWSFDSEHPAEINMSLARKLAYHAIHILSPVTLQKYEFHVYHAGVEMTESNWEAGIKGSVAHPHTSDFVPIFGHAYSPVPTESGVYPYYMRGVVPAYSNYETNEGLNYSPYGFTVAEIERQQTILPPAEWQTHYNTLQQLPGGYNVDLDIALNVKVPAAEMIDSLANYKLNMLDASLPTYNQGLAAVNEEERLYAPVTVDLLELFGEAKKYKTSAGKLEGVGGKELMTAEYAKLFYAFWENVNTPEKMEQLTINTLIETLLPIHEYLNNNLTEEAKGTEPYKSLIEEIPNITTREQAEKVIGEMQKTSLWIGTFYKFESPEDEKKYERAATISELLHTTDKKNKFGKLHRIALAELAAAEAQAIHMQMLGFEQKIMIMEPGKKEYPAYEPMPIGVLEDLAMNKIFSETPIIKGTGEKRYVNLEDIDWGTEFPSMFDNDMAATYDGASAVVEAINTLNDSDATMHDKRQAAQTLAEALAGYDSAGNYIGLIAEDFVAGEGADPQLVEAMNALKNGDLERGLELLHDAPAMSEAFDNLFKFYTLKVDETGITYMGLGTIQRIQFDDASQKVWAAMLGQEELKGALLYEIDLMYKYIWAEAIPAAFVEMKPASSEDVASGKAESINELIPTGKIVGAYGEIVKHKFGLAANIASPTLAKTREYFGNVFTTTFTVSFSHDTMEFIGKDLQPNLNVPAELQTPKEIKVKGKKFSLDFIGIEFRFPAIKKRVKLESIQAGFINVVTADLVEKTDKFKPAETANLNPIISTTLSVDAVKKDHFLFQIYGTPALLVAMGDPKFLGEVGVRMIGFGEKQALLVQLGTEFIYPATTEGEYRIKPIKGSIVWHTPIGISLSFSAWANYAKQNAEGIYGADYKSWTPGGEIMITFRPAEMAKKVKEKKAKKKKAKEEAAKKKAEEAAAEVETEE